jgi:ATP-dependent DNA helicase PIF1
MDFLEFEYKMELEKTHAPIEFKLTEMQQKAYDYMVEGKNIFLTGPSGSGKSAIIHLFKKTYGNRKTIAITSTTGVSALLIGGVTLHSYLGIGLGTGTAEELTEKIMSNSRARQKWLDLDVLIMDEVSMLSPVLFDKLEQVARNVRRTRPKRLMADDGITDLPFGGIQLVISGDFLQLPVIGESDSFTFDAVSWERCVDEVVVLTKIMRQTNKDFQEVLNEIRVGHVSKKARKLLKSRIGAKLTNELGIKPTRIHTTNAAVDEINEKELNSLNEENFFQYDMEIYFFEFVQNREQMMEKYRKSSLAPESLQLCVGAQVMLLCNLDLENGLANGTRGVVTGFSDDLPIVRFLNGEERIISNWQWDIEEGKKKSVRITQMPLKLAWAVTVHKCQGSTLDYAEVDLSNVFTYGQTYVALSRVTSAEGLSIVNINFENIQAHPRAVQYYKNLKTEE